MPARAEARAVYKQGIHSESLAEPTEGMVSFQVGIWAWLADVISYRKELSGQCQGVAAGGTFLSSVLGWQAVSQKGSEVRRCSEPLSKAGHVIPLPGAGGGSQDENELALIF